MSIYYVDNTNGNDSFAGTSTVTAWKTIAKVNSTTLNPGDTVLFCRGCLWREQLTVSQSGNAGNPITFDVYGTGIQPEISGTDLLTGWTLNSGSVYQVSYTNAISTYLLIEDGTIATGVGSLGAITQAGEFYADDTNHIIYYWATDSANPNTHVMEVGGRYNNIVCNNQSYLTFNNLHLHGAGGQVGAGLHSVPTSALSNNLTINNCEVDYAYYTGVWFSHLGTSSGDSITVQNCNIHNNYTVGLFFDGYQLTYPGQYTSAGRFTNVLITGNHIHHNGNVVSAQHGCYVRYVQAPTVTYNEFDHNQGSINWSSGIYFVSCPNSIMKYNLSHNNHWDNYHYDVNSNGFTCLFNISYGAGHQGFMIEEHYRSDGTSLLAHNLSFNDVSGLYFGPGGTIHTVTGVTAVNNIFIQGVSRSTGIDCSTGGVPSNYFDNTVDYNIYTIANGANALMQTVSPNASYTLVQWQAFTGWDTHSFNVDPQLIHYVNDGTGNYHLQSSSPAIGSGIATSADPSTDYGGVSVPLNGRYDLGPYMFSNHWGAFML